MKTTKITTVNDVNGKVIELPILLTYSNLNTVVPQSIIDFETKRQFSKIEFGILVNNKKIVEEHKGCKGFVAMTVDAYKRSTVFSHIHPRNVGMIGGTFSAGDLEIFVEFKKLHTYRAVTKEGVYSMTKLDNFDPSIVEAYKKYDDKLGKKIDVDIATAKAELDKLNSFLKVQLNNGIMTQEMSNRIYANAKNEYYTKCNSINNIYLVSSHNWLLKNQKKFGYTYGLIAM